MALTERQIAYNKFMFSPEWQAIKDNLFKIRGKKCERCKSIKNIQVHHKTYKRFGGKEKPSDLEILCGSCHMKEHNISKVKKKKYKGKKPVAYYRKIALNHGLIDCGGRNWKKLAVKLSVFHGTNRKKFNVKQAKAYVKLMLKDYL